MSSAAEKLLTTCCICLDPMIGPIRTLPCLHSACVPCIELLGEKGQEPPRCPLCRCTFQLPSSRPSSSSSSPQSNPFASHFVASSIEAQNESRRQGSLDPNRMDCDVCEKAPVFEYCKDCGQFLCQGCRLNHARTKGTAAHQFDSVDAGLEILGRKKELGWGRPARCARHQQQEVNTYCPAETCKLACCPECVVDFHAGHPVERLTRIAARYKGEIDEQTKKVRTFEGELSQVIDEVARTMTAVTSLAKDADAEVHLTFERIRELLAEREAELLREIEKESHQKTKALQLQREELEFEMKAVRGAATFGEQLVQRGSETDIFNSHKLVTARLATLIQDKKKMGKMGPVVNEVLDFVGGDRGIDKTKVFLQGLGAISVDSRISLQKSKAIPGDTLEIPIHQEFRFEVNAANEFGEKPVAHESFQVKIEGPSKGLEIVFAGKQVSFCPNRPGDHEISVLYKDRHFPGSPFKLKVTTRPTHRRDFGSVADQPSRQFGSRGSEGLQFQYPYGVASNLAGQILVSDLNNHRIQVFDKTGKLAFKFGSQGQGDGQFDQPFSVAVDHRKNSEIVVVDSRNHRLQIFDERGGFLRSLGSKGNGDGQFEAPRGVAIDYSTGKYLVADYGNHRVQVLDPNGQCVLKFGSKGNKNGQFQHASGIGLLSNGRIAVSDYGNNRVQIFDSAGTFIKAVAGPKSPRLLFVDSADNILVADRGNLRIQVFNQNGDHVKNLASGLRPAGVSMTVDGKILVTHDEAHKVSIY